MIQRRLVIARELLMVAGALAVIAALLIYAGLLEPDQRKTLAGAAVALASVYFSRAATARLRKNG